MKTLRPSGAELPLVSPLAPAPCATGGGGSASSGNGGSRYSATSSRAEASFRRPAQIPSQYPHRIEGRKPGWRAEGDRGECPGLQNESPRRAGLLGFFRSSLRPFGRRG